jgi:Zn-dependent protease with chaperone function
MPNRDGPVTRQLSSHYCCRGEDGEDSRGEENGRITPVIGASLAGLGAWLVIAVLGPHLARRLPPATATRLLVATAVAVAASTVIIGGLLAFTWLALLPEVIELGPWSPAALRAHNPVPAAVAVAAAVTITAAIGVAVAVLGRRIVSAWQAHQACRGLRHADGLIVIDDPRPEAFSIPPPSGRVVVTTGLLRGLDSEERRVLLAHEASHITHGHSWWAVAADLAAAVNPMLIPTARAIHHTLERWADEDAAVDVRDRALAARALARSALLIHASRPPAPMLGAATKGVPERVAALLAPAPTRRRLPATLLVALMLVVTATTALVQQHADNFFDGAHVGVTHIRHR